MDVISHASFAELHRSDAKQSPEHAGRAQVLLERFPDFVEGRPATPGRDRARARACVRRGDPADRRRVLAGCRHVRHARHVGGRAPRCGMRDRGGRRVAASRSCVRPATTHSRAARWGSASSATRRSPLATHSASSGTGASRWSTSTCTTETGRRSCSATTRASSRSRCISGRSGRGAVVPARAARGSSTSRWRPAPATTSISRRSPRSSSRPCARSTPTSSSWRWGSTRIATIRWPRWR